MIKRENKNIRVMRNGKKRYYNTDKFKNNQNKTWVSTAKSTPKEIIFINDPSELDTLIGKLVGFKFRCSECGNLEYIAKFNKYYINGYKSMLCRRCKHKLLSKSHPEWQEKGKRMYKLLTGYDNPMRNPEDVKRCKESQKNKYNGKYYNQTEEGKKQLRLFHKNHPEKYYAISYNYFGFFFESSWELAVWIYCIDVGVPIIRSPTAYKYIYNNEIHYYYPDFWIYGLGMVEIKGNQFLNKRNDVSDFVNQFDPTENCKYHAKYLCCKNNDVKILAEKDIIYCIEYTKLKWGWNFAERFKSNNPNNPSYFNINGYNFIEAVPKPYNKIVIEYSSPIIPNKGISPYDIDKDNEYTIYDKGISSFDIK